MEMKVGLLCYVTLVVAYILASNSILKPNNGSVLLRVIYYKYSLTHLWPESFGNSPDRLLKVYRVHPR